MDHDRLQTFRSNLTRELNLSGSSRDAICSAAGVGRRTLGKIEAGDTSPTLDTVYALADALGLSAAALLDDTRPHEVAKKGPDDSYDLQHVLAANFKCLMARERSKQPQSRLKFSKVCGVADGTLGRIQYGSGNPTLDSLARLSSAFNVQPWQLIMPGLGYSSPSVAAENYRPVLDALALADESGAIRPEFLDHLSTLIRSLCPQA